MKAGLVQYSPVWENKEKNIEKIDGLLSGAEERTDLLVFPEMTLTGFTMSASEFAEKADGKSFEFFSGIALKNKTHVLAGIVEEDGGNFYNTLLHINESGETVSKYRKLHPFSYSTEDKHYKKGSSISITEIGDFKIGLSICYDLRFPELYRLYGKERVHLAVVIANWPVTRIEHWRALLKARAIENQFYVIGVNRVGNDPKLKYNGYSSVYDPMGAEIVFSADEEKVITADIFRKNVEETRTKLPFLDDMYLI